MTSKRTISLAALWADRLAAGWGVGAALAVLAWRAAGLVEVGSDEVLDQLRLTLTLSLAAGFGTALLAHRYRVAGLLAIPVIAATAHACAVLAWRWSEPHFPYVPLPGFEGTKALWEQMGPAWGILLVVLLGGCILLAFLEALLNIAVLALNLALALALASIAAALGAALPTAWLELRKRRLDRARGGGGEAM